MDGLRLALIVFGIVVVAVVYFWTARRRRLDREAGDFDRFDAWTDAGLDPLAPSADETSDEGADGAAAFDDWISGADDATQPNLSVAAVQAAKRESARESGMRTGDVQADDSDRGHDDVVRSEPPARGRRTPQLNPRPTKPRAAPSRPAADPAQERVTSRPAAGFGEEGVIEDLQAIASSLDVRPQPRIGALDDLAMREPVSGATAGRASARVPPATRAGREPHPGSKGVPHDHPPAANAEMVVTLYVMARSGQSFDGPALKEALEAAGLRAGAMQLYHYRAESQGDDSTPLFSALNAVKPGTLDPGEFAGMHTPGIALVLRMPGLERPSEAFELMLGAARRIAGQLNGQVCDDTRSTLTGQALNHIRERNAAFAFRAREGA